MAKGSSSNSVAKGSSSNSVAKGGSSSKKKKVVQVSKEMLSESKAANFTPLSLSKTIIKHRGKDIIKKHANKKSRFLFSFPGFLAALNGTGAATIGHFQDLSTQNPILYLHFPQGRMKLFGTIVYPKNRYKTLQFKGVKNVLVDDFFDTMVVFPDVWWIGIKEDNPEESKLDFPKELIAIQGQHEGCDFKGGAGAAPLDKQVGPKTAVKCVAPTSPDTDTDNDLSDDEKIPAHKMEVTPARHSARNSWKKLKYTDISSEDDPVEIESIKSEDEDGVEETKPDLISSTDRNTAGNLINSKIGSSKSTSIIPDIDNEDLDEQKPSSKEVHVSTSKATKSKKVPNNAVSVTKESSKSQYGSLVQTTISTLFKKVEEKTATKTLKKSSTSKVSGDDLQQKGLKRKIVEAEGSVIKEKVTRGKNQRIEANKKEAEVEDDDDDDDDIEELSPSPQDSDASDEDWAL